MIGSGSTMRHTEDSNRGRHVCVVFLLDAKDIFVHDLEATLPSEDEVAPEDPR